MLYMQRWVMHLDVYVGTHTRARQLILTIKRSMYPHMLIPRVSARFGR